MDDLISRKALIDYVKAWQIGCGVGHDQKTFINAIEEQPPVEARSVVHGEWIDVTGCLDSVRQYACSRCGSRPLYNLFGNAMLTNYCHFCSADMRKKVQDEIN